MEIDPPPPTVEHKKEVAASADMYAVIRAVLLKHGRLGVDAIALSDEADLYQAGLTSHASVNVMLALESAFDIEFPDELMKRSVFSSISSIGHAVSVACRT